MMYTSRSACEAYQDCPRLRYNTYHLLGKGVVPIYKSVPLVTGGAVHRGVEHMMNRVRINQPVDVDTAVGLAVEQYIKDCEGVGFSGKGLQTDRQQWFTFNEQKALVEALVRAWAYIELPNIVQRYKVVAVEREVLPVKLTSGVMFQAKVDAELQELNTNEYYNYSLKTCKSWSERMEATYRSDLQGITETWAIEEESRVQVKLWNEIQSQMDQIVSSQQYPDKNVMAIVDFMRKKVPAEKRLMGIRFCFLLKGMRKKQEYGGENALHITYSPLIRGYKNITPTDTKYAHSWFYPNPENKSGKSVLGKGWEPFNVWESDISIRDWMDALSQNLIQPECGDIIRQQVVTPTEYFRDEAEIVQGIAELKYQEEEIMKALVSLEHGVSDEYDLELMQSVFPHYKKSCEFLYGNPCVYKDLCWRPEVASDPLGSGLYQIRTPHHKAEMEV